MSIALKPIKPKRISDQVFEQIRELIFRGQLKPGEQLMPERELAEAMSVSRTTVRNAINKLVVLGLLEQKQGQGTFVLSPDKRRGNPLAAAMEATDATLDDLLEVRLGLECNAASLAARRAGVSDIQFLENSIHEMAREVESGRLGTQGDVSFHMAILMKNFYDFLFVGIKKNLLHLYQDPANLEIILSHHQSIFDAIRKKDPQEAFQAMHNHISYVQNFFRNRK